TVCCHGLAHRTGSADGGRGAAGSGVWAATLRRHCLYAGHRVLYLKKTLHAFHLSSLCAAGQYSAVPVCAAVLPLGQQSIECRTNIFINQGNRSAEKLSVPLINLH